MCCPALHKESGPLKPEDITHVEIDRGGDKLVFVRASGSERWRIAEPRDYPADSATIDKLVKQILDARLDDKSDVVNNPKQYGLDTPSEVITLSKEGEPTREVKLNVGNESPGKEKAVLYVTSSDRSEVMAVKKSELESVKQTLADFRSRDLLSPAAGDIQAFTLTERTKDKVTRGPIELKKGSEERWTYVQPPYGDAQATGVDPAATDKPPSNVQSVLTDISNLKVAINKDFVADDVKDLHKYNLDPAKDDILRIEIDRVEEIGKNDKGDKEKKTAKVALLVGIGKKVDDKGDQYYAYVEDPKHKDIVKIAAKSVARFLQLLEHTGALRDRNLVELGSFRKPDAIDIKNSWGVLEFRRTSDLQKQWKLWRGDKSYAVDEQAMQALLSALTQKDQADFPDSSVTAKQLGLDKPEDAGTLVTVWADSLPAADKKDEKKDDKKDQKPQPKDKDKPAFRLYFGSETQGKVAVLRKRGNENAMLVLAPIALRDQVRKEPLAYLDKELPPFNATRFDAVSNVTKLTLTRDGTTYEISSKGDAWKIDKPADYAGRSADRQTIEDMLRDLNGLRAVKIVEDKIPADAKLTEWGLKDPRVKAVVTLTKDGKPKTFEYDFGKDTADGVYLRASQQDMISVVSKTVVSTLQRELQDPTVFHFDVAKVKEIKLTGWTDVVGKNNPYVLDVKRDKGGSDWVVGTSSKSKIDVEKLQRLLMGLSNLKASKFVAHKSKPTAEQGLEVDQGALKIEITVEGEKEPLLLTVGKADGNVGFFALSNKLPGDIFEVRKDLFEGPKSKPAYFDK